MAGHVFISYSRVDRGYVAMLAKEISVRGIPVWYDEALQVGERFDLMIEQRIDSCVALVVVLTPDSATSQWVGQEINYAQQVGRPVLPLLLKPCDPPIFLNLLHRVDVTGGRIPDESFFDRLRGLTAATPDSGLPRADRGAVASRPTGRRAGTTARRRLAIALVASTLASALTVAIGLVLLVGDWMFPGTGPSGSPSSMTHRDSDGPALAVLMGHQEAVNGVAFSPDGTTLATASRDRTTIIWDVSEPERPRRVGLLSGHTGHVYGVVFHPGGRTLATSSADRTVRLWDVTDPANVPPPRVLEGHKGVVYGVAFHPDGRTLVTTSADRTVRLWNPDRSDDGGRVAVLDGDHSDAVYAVDFDREGGTLVTTSRDRTAILWSVNGTTPPRPAATLTGHTDFIDGARFDPDGRLLVTASRDRTAILWDVSDSASPRPAATLAGHDGTVFDAEFSPNHATLATVSADRTIRLWNIAQPTQPEHVATLRGHTDDIHACAFSPDGKLLATTSADRSVRLWRVAG